MKGKFYVYVAYGVNNEVLYVGKGKGERYKHCLNGASNCREINQYYFQNGCDGSIKVEILNYFNSDEEALSFEKEKIFEMLPLFNKDHNPSRSTNRIFEKRSKLPILERLENGEKVDFSRLMRKYINAVESGDLKTINMIQKRSEIHKQYVSILGISKVKSIGYNKTKLSNAYNLAIKFSQSNQEIKSNLKKLKIGGKYTSAHIISLLQSVYNELGIDRKAVSNDIKNYFNVAKTQVVCPVDGKRKQGFRIVGDIYEEEL